MNPELSGWRTYALLLPVLAMIGAGVWWRATGYRTNVGLGIAAAGLGVAAVGLIASQILSRRK